MLRKSENEATDEERCRHIRKHAQLITPEMEEKLWRFTGEGLINIVFWYACRHRDLQKDQFIR